MELADRTFQRRPNGHSEGKIQLTCSSSTANTPLKVRSSNSEMLISGSDQAGSWKRPTLHGVQHSMSSGSKLGRLVLEENMLTHRARLWSSPCDVPVLETQTKVLCHLPISMRSAGSANEVENQACDLFLQLLVAPVTQVIRYLERSSAKDIHPLLSKYSSFNYFNSLAVGCACAFLLCCSPDMVRSLVESRVATRFAASDAWQQSGVRNWASTL